MILGVLTLGPVQFDKPAWLWLGLGLWLLVAWIARSSLSGMGTRARRVALVIRLLVVLALVVALAEPQWRRTAHAVAVTAVLDSSKSIPPSSQQDAERYVEELARSGAREREDGLGVVTAAENAYVQQLPRPRNAEVERRTIGGVVGTNLASAVRMALAIRPEDAAYRLLVVSDGNETAGSILDAAQAAVAAGVPIDVLPVSYEYDNEVVVEEVSAPATARMGQTVRVKTMISATRAARGRLFLRLNGEAIDADPGSDELGMAVELKPGLNPYVADVTIPGRGPMEFTANFVPDSGAGGAIGDTLVENNQATSITFASSEGRVLVVADDPAAFEPIARALRSARIAAEVRPSDTAPSTLEEMAGYDAILLVDQPAYAFSEAAQEELRRYVHDSGGGLVMIGGPNSFGAGGWIGSPLEDALPIRLDPPQKREMPKGALALVMHSIEMPQGVYWGKEICKLAVDALSRLDVVGINEMSQMRYDSATWVYGPAEVGDKRQVYAAIDNLSFGDMQDFTPSLRLTLKGLAGVDAGIKHAVIVSDGDPAMPSPALLQQFKDAKITISTVSVFPHGGADINTLQYIAQATGGRYYPVNDQATLALLPKIIVKETHMVKRPLIWEGAPFQPSVAGLPVETMRGIASVPMIDGYVVTGEREGKTLTTIRGKENDPIAAQWSYGLGKSIVFTSDATARWSEAWLNWGQFEAFWEQHVRWVMRPTGSANVRVTTIPDEGGTRVIVEAVDAGGEPLDFATFRGRVAGPDGEGRDVSLSQKGPGRYEGLVESGQPGSYIMNLQYLAPGADGRAIEGSVQAAITRPYADEYRALKDNAPLLAQVAELTGGRVLSGDPKADNVWRREGVTMPVALRPWWLLSALVGIGLFLTDVAVRRVRIDPRAIVGRLRRALGASRQKAGDQLTSLRDARAKAQEKIAERARPSRADAGDHDPGVKFEAGAGSNTATPVIDTATPQATPAPTPEPTSKPAPGSKPGDQGLSRLMQAKRRARDEMTDE